ncbi:MAG: DUF4032 domain-containing protein [Actinobacteria bacterium]|nr:DUF4032 domain-containing protein [Actinomycetota bacterium]
MGTPRLHIRPGNPDFLDLPWEEPISDWDHRRLVEMPTGIHRHPVVFVAYEEGVFAVKELPASLAENEFEVLSTLEGFTTRAAEPAGLMERVWVDAHSEQAAAVITRYVRYAFPYRTVVSGPGFGRRRTQMLDAVAGLLVELHLAGCYWGDCSLSNVLYRYDAGAMEAIMIDGETSTIHPSLSDGQRRADIEIMTENVAGEMADLAAMVGSDIDRADLALGEDIARRYEGLWAEVTEPLVIGRDQSYQIRERIDRLHDLGFATEDLVLEPTGDGNRVRMRLSVVGRTFHSDRLRERTGIEASENQARILLGDLRYHESKMGDDGLAPKVFAAMSWLKDSFQPLTHKILELEPGADPVQRYCDFLHYRFTLAQSQGRDVPNGEAFASWLEAGRPGFPVPT